MAVRNQFGFKQHFRNLDWYCHWLLEVDDSGLRDRLDAGDIGDRTVWQINVGEPDTAEVDDLWPIYGVLTGFVHLPVSLMASHNPVTHPQTTLLRKQPVTLQKRSGYSLKSLNRVRY